MTQLAKVKGPTPNEIVNLGDKTILFDSEAVALVPLDSLDYLPPNEYTVLERPQDVESKPPVISEPPAPPVPEEVKTEEAPQPKDSIPLEGVKQKRKRERKPKTSSPKASLPKVPKKGLGAKLSAALKPKRGRKAKK